MDSAVRRANHKRRSAVVLAVGVLFLPVVANAGDTNEGTPPLETPLWVRVFDPVAAGLTVGPDTGVNFQLLNLTWTNVRLTLFDLGMTGSFFTHTMNGTIGSTIGFGGHHRGRRLSHWFITGAWWGLMHIEWIFGARWYEGLFLPAGYEFRMRWGKGGRAVWGLRLFAAYSPVGRHKNDEGGCFLYAVDETKKVNVPLLAGATFFLGK